MLFNVYEASAGSGKTYRLALEYIALALESGQPSAFSHILAVTFTNKATGEMKDRILAQLYNVARGGLDASFMEQLCERLALPAAEVARRAEATLRCLLHHYDQFRVETIDSFFQSLLSNLAHELGLARGFKVDLETEEVASRAVDRLLLSLSNTGRNARTAALVWDYMQDSLEADKGWNISKDLKTFAGKNLMGEAYLTHEAALTAVFEKKDALAEIRQTLRAEIAKEKARLNEAGTALLQAVEDTAGEVDPSEIRSANALRNYAKALQKGEGKAELNKTQQKALDDPLALITKKLQALPAYCHWAEQVADVLGRAEAVRQEVHPYLATATLMLQKLSPLCLLSEIGREVGRINAENDSFMLAKTPDLFQKMVQKEDASFIFERTGTTFHHLMIDEFQDTSRLQWANFKRILLENMSKGERCMVVGDTKQSIYRWRGGDWRILGNIENEVAQWGVTAEKVPLKTNYRSREEVVMFNNLLFTQLARQIDELSAEEKYPRAGEAGRIYEHVEQLFKPNAQGGFVRVGLFEKKTTDEEVMDELGRQIVSLHSEQGVPYGKMGILVRDKKKAAAIVDYFAQAFPEVPLTSDEAFKLSASPAVSLLVAALKFLSDPADTVSRKLCYTLGSQLGVPLADETMEQLEALRGRLASMPLYELCQHLLGLFRLEQVERQGGGQSAYLFSFLDRVGDFVDEQGSDLQRFVEYWNNYLYKQAVPAEVTDAVYIMTIHKSKGLQRHTIFIPFCTWQLDRDMPDDILWCSTANLPQPFDAVPLVPVSSHASKVVKASAFAPFYQNEHWEQRLDSLNMLYVAFTRAEVNLLVWCGDGKNTVGQLVADFVAGYAEQRGLSFSPSGETVQAVEFGERETFKASAGKQSVNPFDPAHIRQTELRLAMRRADVEFKQSNAAQAFLSDLETAVEEQAAGVEVPQQRYINEGKLMHRVMQLIATPADLAPTLSGLEAQGIVTAAEAARIERLLRKRLAPPQVAAWFDGSWELYNECNVLKRDAEGRLRVVRPDRVARRGEDWLVIDYKLARYREEHVEQVKEYLRTLREMGHPKAQGYLFYLLTGQVVEVAG